MGRLANLRQVDPVLTALAIGYSNAEMVGDFLMPFVPLDKEAGKIPVFGKEAFKLYNTLRAIRAMSNRLNPDGIKMIDVAMDEHDIEYPIDYREDAESAFNLQAHATHTVTELIQIRREKDIADLAQDTNNYSNGNSNTLSGTSQFTDPASDVLGIFDDAKEAISSKIGRDPNRMVLAPDTFKALRRHPQLLELNKFTKRGLLSITDLQEMLEIEEIKVAKAIYSDDAGQFHRFWQGTATLAYVPKAQKGVQRSIYNPSYGYTVRRKGMPKVDVRTEGGKLQLVRATDIFRPYLLGADAGYLIKNTVK